jgi:hypothetical protein
VHPYPGVYHSTVEVPQEYSSRSVGSRPPKHGSFSVAGGPHICLSWERPLQRLRESILAELPGITYDVYQVLYLTVLMQR